MRFQLFLVLVLSSATTLLAQQVKKVVGTYSYYAPEDVSLHRAKQIALERAQLEAIAEVFGTDISQHNATRISNKNGHSDIDFISISSSDIKGEWVETIGTPEYFIYYDRGLLVVKCTVKGLVREIDSVVIDIKSKVLRNGTEDRFESSEFRAGDDLYLSFQSPIDGYLAVYLIDDNGDAFCLLPYKNQTDGIQKISANTPYVFFSGGNVPLTERMLVDEYTLTCEHSIENNQIYIIFSPNVFVKANDNDSGELLPREIGGTSFQKWLANIRRKDPSVNFCSKQITIIKQ